MPYCSNCGTQIADDAYFCPKCGTKTLKGRAANVVYPPDELREAFNRVGTELDKAFTTAAKETHAAIQRAAATISPKAAQRAPVVCSNCGAQNAFGSVYCTSCGKKLTPP